MTRLVLDASVMVKWVFETRGAEPNTAEALEVLQGLRAGRIAVLQPPHWLAEVAAVISRIDPQLAPEAVGLLYSMELPVTHGLAIYNQACALAVHLRQHVFDTLYHAVALCEPEYSLVTADDRYYRKAHGVGSLIRLKDFRLS